MKLAAVALGALTLGFGLSGCQTMANKERMGTAEHRGVYFARYKYTDTMLTGATWFTVEAYNGTTVPRCVTEGSAIMLVPSQATREIFRSDNGFRTSIAIRTWDPDPDGSCSPPPPIS